jgi:GDP-mannose 6-dehydrogenase
MPSRTQLTTIFDQSSILPRGEFRQEKLSLIGFTEEGLLRMGCLGEIGHNIVALSDANGGGGKVSDWLSACREPYLGKMLEDAAAAGRIAVASDLTAMVARTDCTLICVNVPVVGDGSCDLADLGKVLQDLGAAIAAKGSYHSVVVCTAVPPGTTMGFVVPTLEQACGGDLGAAFGVGVWPQPVNPGRAVDDFFAQRRIVVAASDRETTRRALALFDGFDSELVVTSLAAAELHSYAVHAWKALHQSFEAEIAEICSALDIPERDDVMPRMDAGRRSWNGGLHLVPTTLPARRSSRAQLLGFVRALDYIADILRVPAPTIRGLCESGVSAAQQNLGSLRFLRP